VALAGTGARVVAVETDRRLLPALHEVVAGLRRVRVVEADALDVGWGQLLDQPGPWSMVANLPYNVSVPVIMRALEEEPRIERLLVMIQREVGERLAASPGDRSFGAVSLRVAYRAEARVVRSVSRSVFWPQPGVDSVLVSIARRPPPVDVVESDLWRAIDVAFSQRRKTMRGALVRMGLARAEAERVLAACEVDPMARPEQLGLSEFACLARRAAEASRR
jgi:16S rRNA (adenine1518-N6/adenine1519-N6)-dimethyltransferase